MTDKNPNTSNPLNQPLALFPISLEQIKQVIKEVVQDCIESKLGKSNSTGFTEDFIDSKEAARFMKVTLPTLFKYRKMGIVLSHKIEGRRLYKKSELIEAITKKHFGKGMK